MQRFSRLFWFTVLVGGLSSLLLTSAALWFFQTQAAELGASCAQGKSSCASQASLQHLLRVAFVAQVTGTLLSFGLAYYMGRRFISPPPQAAKGASQ